MCATCPSHLVLLDLIPLSPINVMSSHLKSQTHYSPDDDDDDLLLLLLHHH